MDFKDFKHREVKTKKLLFRLEFELNNSTLEEEEAANRVQRELSDNHGKYVTDLIIFLMRATSSSTWELKSLELLKPKEEI